MIPVTTLRPFTRMLMTIGQIPTSYLISISYEEQLLWLCNFLKKEVIPAINNNAEAVKEVQELYKELKSYVDNYFENLDVQEEINNKLDEMAESGQLTDIIAQYLNLAGVRGDNTVNDMKDATNLVNGSFARTYGLNTYNDGKGEFYKIRTITSSDVVDGVNIIAVNFSDTLIAEKMPNFYLDNLDNPINVLLHGVVGDGVTDNSTAIQSLIDNNPNKTLYFPNGTYLLSKSIITSANYQNSVQLKLDKYAILKADSNFTGDYVIELGGKDTVNQSMYNIGVLYGLDGGIIDCNNVCGGIFVYGISPTVTNTEIRNCATIGIKLPNGVHNGSADAYISNIHIFGNNDVDTIGVDCEAADNTIQDVKTYKTQIGIKITGGANYIRNIHCLYSNDDLTNYNSSIAFYIKSWNNSLYQCYSDQFSTGFYIDGNYRNYFYTPYIFYYEGGNYTHTAFYCNGLFNCFIDNPWIEFKSSDGTNTVLKLINKNYPEGNITNMHISNPSYLTLSDEECYNPKYNYSRIKVNLSNITTSGILSNNNITALSGTVNFSINIKGLTIPANTNTTVMTLPNGFRPISNTNVLIYNTHDNAYQGITCWINTSGEVHINSAVALDSNDELYMCAFYTVN